MHNNNPEKLPEDCKDWFQYERRTNDNFRYDSMKKIVISDCDGVITDSKSIYGKEGKLFKTYGAYDKEAIELMIFHGWQFYFVTDDKVGYEITKARLQHLKSKFEDHLEFGNIDKNQRIQLIKRYVDEGYIVYFIGDSLSDIASMSAATYSGCPNNSPSVVKKYCHYVSHLNGSEGGFADLLLECNEILSRELV